MRQKRSPVKVSLGDTRQITKSNALALLRQIASQSVAWRQPPNRQPNAPRMRHLEIGSLK
jgi:hypothetical protein